MYITSITYKDFNGDERTDRLYFHLSQADLTRLELSHKGGIKNLIIKIINEHDNYALWNLFEELIAASYGVKSADGKRFMKNPEILNDFKESNGYSEFIFSLFDSEKANEFVSGLVQEAKQEQLPSIPAPQLVK